MSKPVRGYYAFARFLLRPFLTTWVRWEVTGLENLPREGGYLVAPNHISNVDPLFLTYFLAAHDIPIRFMAKSSLFTAPVVGPLMRNLHMVPVDRHAPDPGLVLEKARQALRDGEVIGVYAEGTLTADPGMWPMRLKTGLARLALDTGVPVIPIAQWGAQRILPRYTKSPDLRPRRLVRMSILEAVDLSDLVGPQGSKDHAAVDEATRRIHAALTAGVEELRGEAAPDLVWDPETMGYPGKPVAGSKDRKPSRRA